MTTTLSPADAHVAIQAGALLVDIRDGDDHARERSAGAINLPLGRIDTLCAGGRLVIFDCRSGISTATNASQLAHGYTVAGAGRRSVRRS